MKIVSKIANNDRWDVSMLSYPFENGINFQLKAQDVDKIYKS